MVNDGVVVLRSYYEAIKILPKREQNLMYSAIFEYVFDNKEPELSPKLCMIWTLIRPNLDASAKRYNANKSNSIKGGRPSRHSEIKTQSKNPINKPNQKTTLFIDKEYELDKDKEKDIYIYTPAALLSQLSENERRFLEELAGDKMNYLLASVAAWLNAGHETQSVYNTCMTFIRNSPREFKGKPIEPDINGPDGFHFDSSVEFVTTDDGYEEARTTQYKVYNDGRREKV